MRRVGCADGGVCVPEEGGTCRRARVFTADHSEIIDRERYGNEFEMPAGSCVPYWGGQTDTDGADVVYEVAIDDGYSLVRYL